MFENLSIAMLIVGILSVVSGSFIFLLLRYFRRQEDRLKLIMKTLYLNTKGIKTVTDKTDMIFLEQQNCFDSQRKSFDHHRVLVSSLNRQLKHIEAALYNGAAIDPTGGNQIDPQQAQIPTEAADENPVVVSPGSVEVHHNGGMRSKDSARRKGVTLLKSLLEEKRKQSSDASETVPTHKRIQSGGVAETVQPEKQRHSGDGSQTPLPDKRVPSSEAAEAMQKADKLTAIFEENFKMSQEPRRAVNG